jgi:tetratricopeptide (TPR) repeat protein/TolB-like protein
LDKTARDVGDSPDAPVPPAAPVKRFLAELKRRHVFQVAATYGVVGFGVIEVADLIFPRIPLPEWTVSLVVWLVLLGFPLALVLAWAFETTPDGVRRTRRVRPTILDAIAAQPASRRWPVGLAGAVGGGLLVGAAWFTLANAERTRPRSVDLSIPPSPDASPAVAVLPFRVVGDEIDYLGEGMVDLLTTNLGGVPGLRAINPQSIMSAWRRATEAGVSVDPGAALGVASSTGAAYAIDGSVIQAGDRGVIRLTADVYDLAAGEKRGTVQVDGPADSVMALVDELTIQALRTNLLPLEGDLPLVNMSRVTTRSLPALKAYLAGEEQYRRGRYAAAIRNYQAAVEEDSIFARAMFRLGTAYMWEGEGELRDEYLGRAARLASRLPERDSMLVTVALAALREERLEGLEEFTRRFPDDADGWFLLGDGYFHLQGVRLEPPETYRLAFEAALERAPHYREAYVHLVDDAAARLDRERIAGLIARQSEVDSPDASCPGLQVLYDLRWGDATAHAVAAVAADTLPFESIGCIWSAMAASPETMERGEREVLAGKSLAPVDVWRMFGARLNNGQAHDARRLLAVSAARDARFKSLEAGYNVMLYLAGYRDSTGLGSDLETLRVTPMSDRPGETGYGGFVVNEFWLGALALSEHRSGDLRAAIASIDSIAAVAREADPVRADSTEAYGLALGEFAKVLGGANDLAAFETAESKIYTVNIVPEFAASYMRFEIGRSLLERGDLERAERYLRSIYPYSWPFFVPAQYELGRLYEETGEREKARVHYRIFAEWWEHADAELQPRRDRALEALRRLAPDS